MDYFIYSATASLVLAVAFTAATIRIARKFNVIDKPGPARKIHKSETPLLGGLAIFLAFFLVLFFSHDKLVAGNLEYSHWLGFFIGAGFLMLGGFLDDKYGLKPEYQIIWPLLAVASVILGGVSIEKITNPFDDFLYFDSAWFSHILITCWLLGMMYTTKLLDGLDGLVTGMTAIGAAIIFLFTMTTAYFQPDIGLASLVLASACAGFLVFNWHPAKIFLGDGGSLFLGYALGVLSIISGSKIAIALLVMGLPVLDVFWTIARRLAAGQNPFRIADRKHLHFRLLDLNLGYRKTVLIFYGLSALFGVSALFLQSLGKFIALLLLIILMLAIIIILNQADKKRQLAEKKN